MERFDPLCIPHIEARSVLDYELLGIWIWNFVFRHIYAILWLIRD